MRFDIIRMTLRQLLGTHRVGLWILVAVIVGLPIIAAFGTSEFLSTVENMTPEDAERFLRSFDDSRRNSIDVTEEGKAEFVEEFRSVVLNVLVGVHQLPILFPILAVIFAAMALREEIQNDTVAYLWVKPIPRFSILISKFVTAFCLVLIFSSISLAGSVYLLSSDTSMLTHLLLTNVLGVLAYSALFMGASMFIGRTILVGIVYILIWEGALSRISTLTSNLSIRYYVENFASAGTELSIFQSNISLESSLIVLLAITAAMLALAVWRFSSMEFAGSSEE